MVVLQERQTLGWYSYRKDRPYIGVGRFRILGRSRFGILGAKVGGGGGAQILSRNMKGQRVCWPPSQIIGGCPPPPPLPTPMPRMVLL